MPPTGHSERSIPRSTKCGTSSLGSRHECDAWSYLDTTTGVHAPTSPDPDFQATLHHLNPHQC
jgi:hypothetical protein